MKSRFLRLRLWQTRRAHASDGIPMCHELAAAREERTPHGLACGRQARDDGLGLRERLGDKTQGSDPMAHKAAATMREARPIRRVACLRRSGENPAQGSWTKPRSHSEGFVAYWLVCSLLPVQRQIPPREWSLSAEQVSSARIWLTPLFNSDTRFASSTISTCRFIPPAIHRAF